MNRTDPFEERLREQEFRSLPTGWRATILAAADRTRALPGVAPVRSASWGSMLVTRFTAFFWPHPTAWAALAALWLLILGLNFATRERSGPMLARPVVPPSPQMQELLKQQEQMMAELLGPLERTESTPHPILAPRSRSQRREDFSYA